MNFYQDLDILHILLKDWRIYELLAAAIGSAAGAWFVFKVAAYSEVQKLKHRESQDLNKAFCVVFTYINSAHNFLKLPRPKIQEVHKLTVEMERINSTSLNQDGLVVVVPFKEAFKTFKRLSL